MLEIVYLPQGGAYGAGVIVLGGCKVWLSGLGGGPQSKARSKHIRRENDNTNAS